MDEFYSNLKAKQQAPKRVVQYISIHEKVFVSRLLTATSLTKYDQIWHRPSIIQGTQSLKLTLFDLCFSFMTEIFDKQYLILAVA